MLFPMARQHVLSTHRAFTLLGASAALALAVTGCSSSSDAKQAEVASPTVAVTPGDGTLVIGALLPGTGEGAQYGTAAWAGAQAALADINTAGGFGSTQVELVLANSGDDLATVDSTFVESGVDVVVGGFSDASRQAVTAPVVAPTGTGSATEPSEALKAKLVQLVPTLESTEYAADTYDAVTLVAAIAEQIGSDDGASIVANASTAVVSGGFACTSFGECKDAISQSEPISYSGASGAAVVNEDGTVSVGRYVFGTATATAE